MATSPIYNWPEPDNTDLVKNGALAMRTLGDAIDTTMATMTPKSLVDAKGDLIAATANDTPARLAVGNNGETLVADSSTSTGLRYNPSITAGKNALINGAFDIWQRGTSFTNPGGAGAYNADRWCSFFNGNGTITQETSVKPDTSTYSLKITATASSSDNAIYQLIEQLQMEQFRGKAVTLSVKIAGTTGTPVGIQMTYSTTANDTLFNTNTSITGTVVANPAINTSTFVTFISTFTVPTTAKTLRIGINSGTMANTNVLYVAEAQLEIGSTATNFSRAGGTIQGELAACQRYLPAISGLSYEALGFTYSTTGSQYVVKLPVTARVAPTGMTVSNVSHFTVYNTGFSGGNPTALTMNTSSIDTFSINATTTVGSPTLVSSTPVKLQITNASGLILFTGCEL